MDSRVNQLTLRAVSVVIVNNQSLLWVCVSLVQIGNAPGSVEIKQVMGQLVTVTLSLDLEMAGVFYGSWQLFLINCQWRK